MMATRKRSVVVAAACAAILAGAIVARAAGPSRATPISADIRRSGGTLNPRSRHTRCGDQQEREFGGVHLSYEGVATNVLFAHIHLGRPAVNGGIMVFLCTNGAPPAGVRMPPPCPQGGGTVSGELTAADVLAVGAQGVAAGDFDAFVDALRAEAGYGNLHSAAFTNGEIRGQVTFSRADSINDN